MPCNVLNLLFWRMVFGRYLTMLMHSMAYIRIADIPNSHYVTDVAMCYQECVGTHNCVQNKY